MNNQQYLDELQRLLEKGMENEIDLDEKVSRHIINAMAVLHAELSIRGKTFSTIHLLHFPKEIP